MWYNDFMRENDIRVKDLTKKSFGRLTVLMRVIYPEGIRKGKMYWLCQCSCGKRVVVLGKSLKNGGTRSCGCYRKDLFAERYWNRTLVERLEKIQKI
jgi:hypothetical protein